MPFVRVQLLEGRTDEQKKNIAEGIIDVLHTQGKASKESVKVIFEEMAPNDYYSGEQFKDNK